jgi:type VI secretion system protein ImpF
VWQESVEQLKASVLRDLENLLNSREGGSPAEAPYDEVARSIYNYGLPDFASMAADSNTTETRLLRAIEREVELFEPRLKDVRISLQEPRAGEERRLGFVIEATLLLDPDPEHIEFDTVLEIDSGQFSLTRSP